MREKVIEVKAALVHFARLYAALRTLSLRERRILEMRYGLDGEGTRTLAEVGTTFAIGKERVRQIEHVALGKLARRMNPDDQR